MKKTIAAVAVAVLVAGLTPARAGEQTRNYIGAFGRIVITPPMCCNTAYGGYPFTVSSGDPQTLSITDESGPGTAVLVCQEAGEAESAPGRCEDGGPGQAPGDDVVQKLCATGQPQELDARFRAGGAIDHLIVYVYPVDLTARAPACPGVGSRGTLVLTF